MVDLFHEDFVDYGEAMIQGLQALRAQEPMSLPDFAEAHFFLPPGSSGVPGPWLTAPFQRGILLAIGNDDANRIVIQKPARVGYTKMLAASIVYFATRKRRSLCLWQPTDTDAKDFVRDEIEPLFEYCPVFSESLIADPNNAKDPRNTASRKEFRGATVNFKGGKSAANYRRMTLDVALLDEYDGFDSIIKGADGKAEGSALMLANVRITDSPYGRIVLGSTPTVRGASQIESELQACDCVLERHVRCPKCEQLQKLEWGSETTTHGIKWDHGDPKTARYVCVHCHGTMEWGDINLIDSKGYWQSDKVRLIDEGEGSFVDLNTGEPCAFPDNLGFKFSTLVSPFFSWTQMVREFIAANDALQLGDRTKMMVFVNTRLGETWTDLDMQVREPEELLARREDYDPTYELPLGVVCVTAGIDVQIDRIEIEFRGWGAGEESWGIQYVKLTGDTTRVPSGDEEGEIDTIYEQLETLLRRTFRHPVYGDVPITIACIDSGYQTSNVYQFCSRDPKTFIPVKGVTGAREVVEFSGKAGDNGVYLTLVGSDNAMDVIHTRLGITQPGPGCYHWPLRDDFGPTYFTQLLAEQRVKKIKNGRPVFTWVCPPNQRNEPADTAKYNLAAIKLAQLAKGVILHRAPDRVLDKDKDKQSHADRLAQIARNMNRRGR